MLTIISSPKEPMYFTAKDFRFFNMAKRRAESNPYPQYPLAAVITQNGNLVSTGCNQEKTHTLQRRFNEYRVLAYAVDDAKIQHYIHAEMDAIRHALRHHHPSILEGASIYIYRSKKGGHQGMARPCDACMAALIQYGIRYINYTTDDGFEQIDLHHVDASV